MAVKNDGYSGSSAQSVIACFAIQDVYAVRLPAMKARFCRRLSSDMVLRCKTVVIYVSRPKIVTLFLTTDGFNYSRFHLSTSPFTAGPEFSVASMALAFPSTAPINASPSSTSPLSGEEQRTEE